MRSTITVPPIRKVTCTPASVTVEMAALGIASRSSTRLARSPRARATWA